MLATQGRAQEKTKKIVAEADLPAFTKLPQAVPEKARVTLQPRRTDYFLGENIIMDFQVENTGDEPFSLAAGGDYRGGTRAGRFRITARDEQGHIALDPHPIQMNFGGLFSAFTLNKGQIWTQTLSILPYCRFETPGEYTVSVSHDLGWKPAPHHPLPVAQAHIRLAMPTLTQARKIVDDLAKLPEHQPVSWGHENPQNWADFSALHYPIYLPLLESKIRAGDARYLPSVAALETPEATRFLIELLDAKPEFARQAATILSARLPLDNALKSLPTDEANVRAERELRRQRVANSWRDEFRAPLALYARRALQSDKSETLRLGAELIQSIGAPADYPFVMAALEKCLEKTERQPRWQFVGEERGEDNNDGWQLQDSCVMLMQAASQLQKRAALPPENSVTAAQWAVQIEKMKTDSNRLKSAWANVVAPVLRHKLPFIRQLALESLQPQMNLQASPISWRPTNLAPVVRAALPALLADSDISVRAAACDLAAASRDRSLVPDVLKNLAQTRNTWDVGAANHAARDLGASFPAAQIWAARLEQPKMFRLAINSLIELTTGRGPSSYRTDGAEQGAIFGPRWQKFLQAHAKTLAAGQKIASAQLPRDLYPADWSLKP